jgi:hypothetical protein
MMQRADGHTGQFGKFTGYHVFSFSIVRPNVTSESSGSDRLICGWSTPFCGYGDTLIILGSFGILLF